MHKCLFLLFGYWFCWGLTSVFIVSCIPFKQSQTCCSSITGHFSCLVFLRRNVEGLSIPHAFTHSDLCAHSTFISSFFMNICRFPWSIHHEINPPPHAKLCGCVRDKVKVSWIYLTMILPHLGQYSTTPRVQICVWYITHLSKTMVLSSSKPPIFVVWGASSERDFIALFCGCENYFWATPYMYQCQTISWMIHYFLWVLTTFQQSLNSLNQWEGCIVDATLSKSLRKKWMTNTVKGCSEIKLDSPPLIEQL